MSRYFIILLVFFTIASCVPAGKLSEAIDANAVLNSKYDSLHNMLNDTIANYTNSVQALKSNLSTLNDSINYYRLLVAKPPVAKEGDVFLNQMLSHSLLKTFELADIKTTNYPNGVNNSWLDSFKADVKKFTAEDADVKLNNGLVFVDISDKILFKNGSYTLSKKSSQILATIANLLQAHPDLSFMIEGHTDSKGFKGKSNNDNWTLSVTRATSVARILQTKYKIDPKRIIAAGRSQYLPIDDNKIASGRFNNRRVRIILLPSLTQLIDVLK